MDKDSLDRFHCHAIKIIENHPAKKKTKKIVMLYRK